MPHRARHALRPSFAAAPRHAPPPCARSWTTTSTLGAGASSGFSGTSGPLKGAAIRSLGLDRMHTVGAAVLASAFGDLTKTAVFTDAAVLTTSSYRLMVAALPLMLVASVAGRRFTTAVGERGYQRLFWLVMAGYAGRLLAVT